VTVVNARATAAKAAALPPAAGIAAAAAGAPPKDVFASIAPELMVSAVGPRHVAVLNKFPVIPMHTVVVTRDFMPQAAGLDVSDMQALWLLVARVGGLGFFNCGPASGASQPRRHTQFIPYDALRASYPPSFAAKAGPLDLPVEAALAELRRSTGYGHLPGEVFRVPALPFPHGIVMLGGDVTTAPAATAARQLHAWYVQLLLSLFPASSLRPLLQAAAADGTGAGGGGAAGSMMAAEATPRSPVTGLPLGVAGASAGAGADAALPSHNVLLTPRWMMVVPRRCGEWGGVPINAVAFAGLLLAKGDARSVIETRGPLDILRECVGAEGAAIA